MIARKKCKCGCQKFPSMGYAGYYAPHAPDDVKEKVGTKRQVAIRNRNKRVALSAKLHKVQNSQDSLLNLWFRYHMVKSVKVCENCGSSLSHYSEAEWRGSQHHIIDKSPTNGCPSVAEEPLNHGVLGMFCCHSQWHTSYDNAAKMPIFKEFKRRFNLFKDKIIESEIRKIPECFLI